MTLYQALEMIERGETPEQYKKRMAKIRRLANEKQDLEDAIEVLGDDLRDSLRLEKNKKRLKKVEEMINDLM